MRVGARTGGVPDNIKSSRFGVPEEHEREEVTKRDVRGDEVVYEFEQSNVSFLRECRRAVARALPVVSVA